jgi:hypothetical protein
MSKARFGIGDSKREEVDRALKLLQEAQTVIDTMDRPHIGARLQEVIDAVRTLPGN